MRAVCPECQAFRDIVECTEVSKTVVRGVEVESKDVYSKCVLCSSEFATPNQMEKSLKRAYGRYYEIMSEIK